MKIFLSFFLRTRNIIMRKIGNIFIAREITDHLRASETLGDELQEINNITTMLNEKGLSTIEDSLATRFFQCLFNFSFTSRSSLKGLYSILTYSAPFAKQKVIPGTALSGLSSCYIISKRKQGL